MINQNYITLHYKIFGKHSQIFIKYWGAVYDKIKDTGDRTTVF